ncbi:MAG: glycerol-3-phosphate acyltransferase [Chloroflexota bacterium]
MIPSFFILLSFFLGCLPFSVWLGRWFAGADVRAVGDGNPGAVNAFKAGGWRVGLASLLLDVTKAALPVGLAYQVIGLRGWPVFFIAIAPTLGHAFSPFLRFQGGKAIATMLGAWIGLTLYEVPPILLFFITFWFLVQTLSGWAALLTVLCALGYLAAFHPDPLLLGVALFQAAFIVYKHPADLRQLPQFRPWLRKRFRT